MSKQDNEPRLIAIKAEDLQDLVDEAVDRALMRFGITDEEDAKDLREAVAVGAFWRRFRKSFVDAAGKKIAGGLMWAVLLAAGFAVYSVIKPILHMIGK